MKYTARILTTRLPILLTSAAVVGVVLSSSLSQTIVTTPSSSAKNHRSAASQTLSLQKQSSPVSGGSPNQAGNSNSSMINRAKAGMNLPANADSVAKAATALPAPDNSSLNAIAPQANSPNPAQSSTSAPSCTSCPSTDAACLELCQQEAPTPSPSPVGGCSACSSPAPKFRQSAVCPMTMCAY